MWNPISWLYHLFKPRITIWALLWSFLPPIIGTILFFTIFTLTFRLLVRPYIRMYQFRNLPGAWIQYIPFFGAIWKFKKDEKKHRDFHFASKKRIQVHPDTRFLVTPYKDKVMVLLYDPELVKEFLSKEESFTFKDPRKAKIFHKSAKSGLSHTQGQQWKSQRQFITEVFNKEFVDNFIPTVQNTAKEWIGHNFKENSCSVEISEKIQWFSAKIGAKLFFGEHNYSTPEEFKNFMQNGVDNHQTWTQIRSSPLRHFFGSKFYKLGLRPIDRQYRSQVKTLNKWFSDMLEKFKQGLQERKGSEGSTTKTLLDYLLEQNEQSSESNRMSNESIIGQMSTFFAAETIAVAAFLTSAVYFLASNKDIQKKLRQEISEKFGNTKSLDFGSINSLEYLDGFIKETFRLQTPTSLLYQRKVKESTTLLDLTLKKGDRVNVDVLGMGYNPKLFSNPKELRPERWIEKKDAGVCEPYAYLPFSDGAHKCPGEQLALSQSKVLLCEMIKKFDVGLEDEFFKPKLGFDFVYHITNPLKVTLTAI